MHNMFSLEVNKWQKLNTMLSFTPVSQKKIKIKKNTAVGTDSPKPNSSRLEKHYLVWFIEMSLRHTDDRVRMEPEQHGPALCEQSRLMEVV